MNFMMAVKHAVIGYGIRRACWQPSAILSMDNFGNFYWLSMPAYLRVNDDRAAKLLGPDATFDLQDCDIIATDWVTVSG